MQVTAISNGIHRFPPCFSETRSSRHVNRGRVSLILCGSVYISLRIVSYALTRKSSKTGFCLCSNRSFKSGCISYVWSAKRYKVIRSDMLRLMMFWLMRCTGLLVLAGCLQNQWFSVLVSHLDIWQNCSFILRPSCHDDDHIIFNTSI